MQNAPLPTRAIAYLIDFAVAVVVYYLLLIPLMFALLTWMANRGVPLDFVGSGRVPDTLPHFDTATWIAVIGAFAVAVVLFIVIYHGYFVVQEYRKGATWGKRLFGLRVVARTTDGRVGPITWKQAVGRDLWRYIDCGFVVPALVSMALSTRLERLGDRLCKTWVVMDQPTDQAP